MIKFLKIQAKWRTNFEMLREINDGLTRKQEKVKQMETEWGYKKMEEEELLLVKQQQFEDKFSSNQKKKHAKFHKPIVFPFFIML